MAEIPGFDLEDRTKVDFRISAFYGLKLKKMNEKKSRFLRFGRERKDLILRKRPIHSNTILQREETHTQHAGDEDRQFCLIFISSLLCIKHWPQRQSKPLFYNQAKIKNQSSFVSL